jgi:enoyl-CoA hydratase/carnithine racemase
MSEATAASENDFGDVLYEQPAERVVRIVLNRPDKANAQNLRMLYGLNAALDRACADDAVRVIIIAAAGKHFSSGHGPMGYDGDWKLRDVAIGTARGFRQPAPRATGRSRRRSTSTCAGAGGTCRSRPSRRCKAR